MDVKQIVLLELRELPIEFVWIREVKLVLIKRVIKVNKVKLQ